MSDSVSEPEPGPLPRHHLERLRELVRAIQQHDGPWGEPQGGEQISPGVYSMPWVDMDELAYDAMTWLYESERIFAFEWSKWDEGRRIFEFWSDEAVATFDHLTVRKLITAIARNDRFSEGAWAQFFEDGQGPALFARLLELEEDLAARF